MNGVDRWLDDGENDGKIVRELKRKSRASEQQHKAALVRSASGVTRGSAGWVADPLVTPLRSAYHVSSPSQ